VATQGSWMGTWWSWLQGWQEDSYQAWCSRSTALLCYGLCQRQTWNSQPSTKAMGGSEWCIQTWSVEASSCVSSCHCHWTDQVWEWFSAFPSVQLHRSNCFLRIPTILLVVHYHHDVLYLLLLILLFSPEVSRWDLCSQYTGNA